MTEQTNVLGALAHLGKCLREGKHTWMGVPAENVCIDAVREIERLRALLRRCLAYNLNVELREEVRRAAEQRVPPIDEGALSDELDEVEGVADGWLPDGSWKP